MTDPTHEASVPHIGTVTSLGAAAFGIGVGDLFARLVGCTPPLSAAASWVIDVSPRWLKEWAIAQFGTGDKAVLQWCVVIVLAAAAVGLGRVRIDRLGRAVGVVAGVGAIGAVIALGTTRPGWSAGVALLSTALTAGALIGIVGLGRSPEPTSAEPTSADASSAEPNSADASSAEPNSADPTSDETTGAARAVGRRATLRWGVGVGLVGVSVGAAGRWLSNHAATTADRVARLRRLPTPTGTAAAGPTTGASVGHGAAPFITPRSSFYRVDTALDFPVIDVEQWRLVIDGMVDRPLTLTYDELLARPLIERHITMACVSNEVGGDYIGTQRWLGAPLAPLLTEAGVQSGADQVASESDDGWTCGFPLSVALDGRDAMIAVGMGGEPLPLAHGFPARLVVPGLYGYVSATKWLTRITLTTFEEFEGYWVPRGWSAIAPIKLQSRIDRPAHQSRIESGRHAIAGVAWAPPVGVQKVEVRVDGGTWQIATLGADVSRDAWRTWWLAWDAEPGEHRIEVRTTDQSGAVQTDRRQRPAPDGATGYHTITVTVA